MNALQLPFKFDATIIKEEIAKFSESDYYDIYNPSVTYKTLWSKHLIEPVHGPDDPVHIFKPNAALKKCPYLLSVLETFKCKKETFRIHTLYPKAVIKPHRDRGFSFELGKVQLHIPIETNDDVKLLLNDEPVYMNAGETWYCNFNIKHEVQNNSNKPRTHLIMDCLVNDWVKELFNASMSQKESVLDI